MEYNISTMRNPAVAGQFYPGDKRALVKQLDEMMVPASGKKIDILGAVVPHAGYIYSGRVAGALYSRITPRDTYIILGPNHTGRGARFAASGEAWSTPLGVVDADRELMEKIMAGTALIKEDAAAHAFEHSIEVQLPFIQKLSSGAKIVPITVQYGKLSELREVAAAITAALKDSGKIAAILASSDMTHYESRESAEAKDKKAIGAVIDLDAERLLRVVEENDISMCGYIPAAIMLMCAKELGAKKGELIKYSDSGETTGDMDAVVGYAGIVVC